MPQITHAVRFIRHNATRFGVAPDKLGIMGLSSGGHLSLMMGVRGDDGITTSIDPVERTSSRVRAAVAFFPPTDFLNYGATGNVDLGTGVLKVIRPAFFDQEPSKAQAIARGRIISPAYNVTPKAAPALLFHGDKDTLVPLQQSQVMRQALRKAGVECQLIVNSGGGHCWPSMGENIPAAMRWFDRQLK